MSKVLFPSEGSAVILDGFLLFFLLNHLEVFCICFPTVEVSDHFPLRFVLLLHCVPVVLKEPLQNEWVLLTVLLNLVSCRRRVLVSEMLLQHLLRYFMGVLLYSGL